MAKSNGKIKPNGKVEKEFNRMQNGVKKDLIGFADKWLNKRYSAEYLKKFPFFMQMRDGMHNALEAGACSHTLNSRIKDAKKEALKYHQDLYKD